MGNVVNTYINPSQQQCSEIMQRASAKDASLRGVVADILNNVKENGDKALREYSEKFDGAVLDSLMVTEEELAEAEMLVSKELKDAIKVAKKNIYKFHEAQLMKPICVNIAKGIMCEQRQVPIQSVGLYIPGGNSPLFSTVLMLAVPASIAGCGRVVLCTPANKQGKVHPAILYAAKVAGVDEIYKSGGAQAIAAMAYGTETVPKVNKIFGPGNRFVMEAKEQVSASGVAIDMPAGPSEVMIIADEKADMDFLASDFLSQAEHGPDSQSILLTSSEKLAEELPAVIEKHLNQLPRCEMIKKSLSHSSIVKLNDFNEIWDFANEYAPEHLIINCEDAELQVANVVNAGSVFIGPYSPESAGDYASGTNHTLPTSGFAKSYNGVNLDSFMKKITFQRISPEGLQKIGKAIEVMAENEDLMAHKLAVSLRLEKIESDGE